MFGKERRYSYELRNTETGKYIADMEEWLSSASDKWHYRPGDEIALPDAILFTNNCWKLRSCIVERLEHVRWTNHYTAYLRVSKKEIKPFGFIDWQKATGHFIKGVDWSGSDVWLDICSDSK